MEKAANRYRTVLRVKRHQEKIAQQQLRRIQDEHEHEQASLTGLHNVREDALNDMIHFGKARVTDVQVQRAFIFRLDRQIDQQTKKVEAVREKEVEKLDELTGRAQSRQMVEQLDERRNEDAAREADKKEQELIDEVGNRSKTM